MLRVGVIFCDGCQTKYDRKKEFLYLVDNLNIGIEYAKKNCLYEYLIIINGCLNCCTSLQGYRYNKVLNINKRTDIEEVIKTLNKTL